jgi:tetratricopeptide (TPR) repeat protein
MNEANMVGDVPTDYPFQEFARYFDFMRHWGDLHEKFVQNASPRFIEQAASGRREFLSTVVAEDDMLVSMSSDLGLFREVIKRLRTRPWFTEDIGAMATEVLNLLLFPQRASLSDERERLSRLYPEVFFDLADIKFGGPKSCPIQHKDIESSVTTPDDLETALTCIRWSAVSKDVDTEERFTALMQDMVDHGTRLKNIDPANLESLSDFQDLLDRAAIEITAKMGLPDDQTSWLLFSVQDRAMVPETLHFFVMQAMGLRLFREMDHGSRHELMDQEYKVQFGTAYAARSMLLLGDYHRDKVQAPEKVLKAIEAHVRDGRPEFALDLCLECLKNLPMESQFVDQMEMTIGILFLTNERPRKAAEAFQRSLESAVRKKDESRASVVNAYLGASYSLLRRKEEAHKAFEESLSIAEKRRRDASDFLEELLLMADLAHESNEHVFERGYLQTAFSMAEGAVNEIKLKQQLTLMIKAAEVHAARSP